MKIALIGDIHANLPALEAVLAHADAQSASLMWNVGDTVGYGAYPDQVVKLIQKRKIVSILGNYDRKVLMVEHKRKKWSRNKTPEKWLAFRWAYEHLSPRNRKYLQSLPEQRRIKVAGRRILLTHGSPASCEEHLTPETPDERLRELSQLTRADIIVVGHSHVPFVRCVNGVWFINTGSVGRADDGDPRTSYALLKLKKDTTEVEHFRLKYDVKRAAKAIRRKGLPEDFARMILEGRNLDAVQMKSEP